MENFNNLSEIIKQNAILFHLASEKSEKEDLEHKTFCEIIQFAISDRLEIANFNFNFVLIGPKEGDSMTRSDYMNELCGIIEDRILMNRVPKKTKELYLLWMKEFYNFEL